MTDNPTPETAAETDAETAIWDPKRLDLRWFEYDHLPEDLQEVARPIAELADTLYEAVGSSAEKSAGLRKLLEAKDCFVRAAIADRPDILDK